MCQSTFQFLYHALYQWCVFGIGAETNTRFVQIFTQFEYQESIRMYNERLILAYFIIN